MRVNPLALLYILAKNGRGLNNTDVTYLLLRLPSFWTSDPRVPESINAMVDVQKKVLQIGPPLSKNLLAAFVKH